MKVAASLLSLLLMLAVASAYVVSPSSHGSRSAQPEQRSTAASAGRHRVIPSPAGAATRSPLRRLVRCNDSNRAPEASSQATAGGIGGRAMLSNLLAASVFSAAAVASVQPLQPANALELSGGAFIVETNGAKSATSKTSIDSQRLARTALTNRKEIAASLKRIGSAVEKELATEPVWKELGREILDVEGDVVPALKFSPPTDWGKTVKDLQRGKVNLLINGEVVNVVVEPTLSEQEDDLVIKVSGFKGERFSRPETTQVEEERLGPIRAYLSRFTGFWDYWNGPAEYLPPGLGATNGGVVLTGFAGSIAAIYAGSYKYYLDQIQASEDAAKQKREAAAAAKKKREAAAAAKQKEEEEKAPPQEKEEKEEADVKKTQEDNSNKEETDKPKPWWKRD